MAIRLVFLAGIIAFVAAFAAWILGGLTPLQAVLFYIASGWIVIVGGAIGYVISSMIGPDAPPAPRRPRSVVVRVTTVRDR